MSLKASSSLLRQTETIHRKKVGTQLPTQINYFIYWVIETQTAIADSEQTTFLPGRQRKIAMAGVKAIWSSSSSSPLSLMSAQPLELSLSANERKNRLSKGFTVENNKHCFSRVELLLEDACWRFEVLPEGKVLTSFEKIVFQLRFKWCFKLFQTIKGNLSL